MVLQELSVQPQKGLGLQQKGLRLQETADSAQAAFDTTGKKLRLESQQSIDKLNQAAGRIHSEYVKLQQEFSKLHDDKIKTEIENKRIQHSLVKS